MASPRKITIAVDLSEESAHAVRWAIDNYLRPTDQVTVLHVRATSVLFGADWGSLTDAVNSEGNMKDAEDQFDTLTEVKCKELAKPLEEAGIPYKIHIVKDHDMKERICLEVERLSCHAVIMGGRGIGASGRSRKARLGSVSDYCVHHCDVPVIVVRLPNAEGDAKVEVSKEDALQADTRKAPPTSM